MDRGSTEKKRKRGEQSPNENSDTDEPCGAELLRKILQDEALCDITLKGNDGELVRANRSVLAAVSDCFRQMLFGGFKESCEDVVEIGFNGFVLKAVVEYIHTREASVLEDAPGRRCDESVPSDQNPNPNIAESHDIEMIQNMVSLAKAASYFDLPGLEQQVEDSLVGSFKEDPFLAYIALQACNDLTVSEEFKKFVWRHVRRCPFAKILGEHVQELSQGVVEEVLSDNQVKMTEYELFKLLELWSQGRESDPNKPHPHSFMSKLIRFNKIDPEVLEKHVSSSKLVTQEQLMEAYKKQAIAAKSRYLDPDWGHTRKERFNAIWYKSERTLRFSRKDNRPRRRPNFLTSRKSTRN